MSEPINARAASRYAADYLLRWVEIAHEVHGSDLLHSLIFAALWKGSADLDEDRHEQKRPLTVRQVTDSLGLPYETVRRRFLEMLEEGVIERAGSRGFVISQSALSNPRAIHGARRAQSSLARFLKELKSIGIEAP